MLARIGALLRMQPPVVDDRGLLYLSGATVPTIGTDGYQIGCIFQKTASPAVGGNCLYVNEGSVTECDFVAIDTVAGTDAGEILFSDAIDGPAISTPDGFDVPFILTGTYASACGEGITLSADNQRPVSFLFDNNSVALGTGNYRAVLSRVYLCSNQAGQIALRAIQGQVKAADAVDLTIGANYMNAINAVEGYIELAGATGRDVGANTRIAALHALLEIRGDITLASGGKVVGILAELAQATGKTVDDVGTAGILVDRVDADHADVQVVWNSGLVIAASSCTTAIVIGDCTTGIDFNGAFTSSCIDMSGITLVGGDYILQAGTIGTPLDLNLSAANCLGLISACVSSTTNGGANRQFITALFEMENKTNPQAYNTLKAVQGNVTVTQNWRAAYAVVANLTRSGSGVGAGESTGILSSVEWGSDTTQTPYLVSCITATLEATGNAATKPSSFGTYGITAMTCCSVDAVIRAVHQVTGGTADAGVLVHVSTGTVTRGLHFDVDVTYGTLTTAIDIEACVTGIAYTGAVTNAAIDMTNITLVGGDYMLKAGTTATPLDLDMSAANCLGLISASVSSTTNSTGGNRQFITALFEMENKTEAQALNTLKAVQANVTVTQNWRAAYAGAFNLTRSGSSAGAQQGIGILSSLEWGSDTTQTVGMVACINATLEATGNATTKPSSSGTYAITAMTVCSVDAIIRAVHQVTGGTADAGLLFDLTTGTVTRGIHFNVDTTYSTLTTAIDIEACGTGIAFTGAVTSAAIDMTSITLVGGDYILKAGTLATPLALNMSAANCLGLVSASVTSTTNSTGGNRQFITALFEMENSSEAQASNTLKALQANTSVSQNWRAAYGGAFSVTRSGACVGAGKTEAVFASIQWGSDVTQTPAQVSVIRAVYEATAAVAGTSPSSVSAHVISAENFGTVDSILRVVHQCTGSTADAAILVDLTTGTLTNGLHFNVDTTYGTLTTAVRIEKCTNAFAFPAEATDPVEAHVADENSTGRIKILVAGDIRYLYYYD